MGTPRKTQTPPEKVVEEDPAHYLRTWHPVTYSVIVWALLWVGSGLLRVVTMIFGMPEPLPRVGLRDACLLALLFGVVSTVLWRGRDRAKRARVEAELAKRRRLLRAEKGLPDPGVEVLKEQVGQETQRIEQVREAFETVCRTSALQALKPGDEEKTIPQLLNVRCTVDLDVEADLVTAGGNGVTIDDIRANARRFAEVADAKRVKIRRKAGSLGRATITFLYTDPLDRFNYVKDLQRPRMAGNLVIGVTEDDAAMEIPSDGHALFAGYTKSGKSSAVWDVLASLTQQGIWTQLLIIDPKKMELAAFKSQVGKGWLPNRLQVVAYGAERDEGEEVIRQAYELMQDRATRFGDMGVSNAVEEVPNSPENPYVLVINDELGDYMDLEKKGSLHAWGQLKQKGRAVGVNVIACAITVNDTEMGAGRKLYGTRVGFRGEEGLGIALFGKDAVSRGAEPHKISRDQQGMGFVVDPDTGEMSRFRAAFVSKDDRARLVQGLLPEGMGSGLVEDEPNGEWPVYWRRSLDKQSLYVGKGDPDIRWQEHKQKAWAALDHAPHQVVWYLDSEAEQLAWEKLMIEQKRPIYNVHHNLDNPIRRDWKEQFVPAEVEPVAVVEQLKSRLKHPRLAAFRARRQVKPTPDVVVPDAVVGADGSLLADLRAHRYGRPRRRVAA